MTHNTHLSTDSLQFDDFFFFFFACLILFLSQTTTCIWWGNINLQEVDPEVEKHRKYEELDNNWNSWALRHS